jgi:RNA polymerase sigma-70 factor (ECF subfamily)
VVAATKDCLEDESPAAQGGDFREASDPPCGLASPEAVFAGHYQRLVRVLSSVEGREAAEDAVQEAFFQLFLNWKRVKAYEDQAGWVRRVAINRLYNRRRSLKRQAAALLRLDTQRAQSEEAPPPAGRLDLLSAIRELPPRRRLIMALYYLDELSVQEIAGALGISKGSVTRQLYQAREDLRRRLGD